MFLGACRRRRRRGGLQLYQLRAAWGATRQLSGISLGLWVSASGGAAQSTSIFILHVSLPLGWGVSGWLLNFAGTGNRNPGIVYFRQGELPLDYETMNCTPNLVNAASWKSNI